MPLVGALDQGTTSTRFVVYDKHLRPVASHQVEHRQIAPHPGWLEHDPEEVVANALRCMEGVAAALGDRRADVVSVGITNQRETTILWDGDTGRPLHPAIVWSDVRTAAVVDALVTELGGKDALRAATGLPLSTYFSAVKVRWLLDNVPAVREAVAAGRCLFGTMDSWLLYNLTGGRVHATDVTNASRTMLMDLAAGAWSADLRAAFGIPAALRLPDIRGNSEPLGSIAGGPFAGVPITSTIGDQQAATVGQACFRAGEAKVIYGSGCFLLSNTGPTPVQSRHGLLTTVCYRIGQQPTVYALEGAIANGGSVMQWLRDNLRLLPTTADSEALAASVPDSGGVIFVPALSGLYAPYWRDDARGTLLGMTQFTTGAHVCRAALEGIAHLARDVLAAMALDSGHQATAVAVDGGMARNAVMMQLQADLLGLPVVRAANTESTSLGCAILAGLAVGVWKDLDEVTGLVAATPGSATWIPRTSPEERAHSLAVWKWAVAKCFTGDRPLPPPPVPPAPPIHSETETHGSAPAPHR